jgi:hypothetical protein
MHLKRHARAQCSLLMFKPKSTGKEDLPVLLISVSMFLHF